MSSRRSPVCIHGLIDLLGRRLRHSGGPVEIEDGDDCECPNHEIAIDIPWYKFGQARVRLFERIPVGRLLTWVLQECNRFEFDSLPRSGFTPRPLVPSLIGRPGCLLPALPSPPADIQLPPFQRPSVLQEGWASTEDRVRIERQPIRQGELVAAHR